MPIAILFIYYASIEWLSEIAQELIAEGQSVIRPSSNLYSRLFRFTQDQRWDFQKFLDYCVERALLNKVGDGYIFIHRLLLEYFATQTELKYRIDSKFVYDISEIIISFCC